MTNEKRQSIVSIVVTIATEVVALASSILPLLYKKGKVPTQISWVLILVVAAIVIAHAVLLACKYNKGHFYDGLYRSEPLGEPDNRFRLFLALYHSNKKGICREFYTRAEKGTNVRLINTIRFQNAALSEPMTEKDGIIYIPIGNDEGPEILLQLKFIGRNDMRAYGDFNRIFDNSGMTLSAPTNIIQFTKKDLSKEYVDDSEGILTEKLASHILKL